MIRAYFLFKRFVEYIGYRCSKPAKRKIVVLTFDDYVDGKSVELAGYLKSKNIPATFFLTLNQTEPSVIAQIAGMAHELGGHSLDHSAEERAGSYKTARQCYVELRKYDGNVVSWRFPWTSKDGSAIENVRDAGFVIDSSVGAFYPVKKLKRLKGLYEIPWLRLPRQWQMDVNEEDYSIVKKHIVDMVSSKNGVFVLGLHTYHQYKHFNEFKELVESLVKMHVEFLTLREAFGVLRNGAL